jgi:hypothetical protein
MLWMRQKLTENLTLALREIANLDASEAKLPVQPCQNGACGDREAHDHGENRIDLGARGPSKPAAAKALSGSVPRQSLCFFEAALQSAGRIDRPQIESEGD